MLKSNSVLRLYEQLLFL